MLFFQDDPEFARGTANAVEHYLRARGNEARSWDLRWWTEYSQPVYGPSAGLPLAAALCIAGKRHGPGLHPRRCATGAVEADGRVLAVGDLTNKLSLAQKKGFRMVVVPPAWPGDGSDRSPGIVPQRASTVEEAAQLLAPLGPLRGAFFVQRDQLGSGVLRPAPFEEAKKRLLAPGAHVVALVGPGGLGKSWVASYLAQDEELRARYQDGVIGAQLSKDLARPEREPALDQPTERASWKSREDEAEAQVRNGLASIARLACDLTGQGAPNLEDAQDLLTLRGRVARALEGGQFLVVLDNVFTARDLNWFRLGDYQGSPSVSLLVTARPPTVAAEKELVSVDKLSDAEARELVTKLAGRRAEGHEQARALEKALEHLGGSPIWLADYAAYVKQNGWERALDKIREITADNDDTAFTSLSVACLPTKFQQRVFDLAVFENRGPITTTAFSALWPGPDGWRLPEALVHVGLAVRTTQDGVYTVHDHHLAYLARKAYEAHGPQGLGSLHARLVDGYLQQPGFAPRWDDVSDDEYFLGNIVSHLLQAGRHEDLVDLLSSFKYLSTKLGAARAGGLTALLADYDAALTQPGLA
jgi:hypothetical protein